MLLKPALSPLSFTVDHSKAAFLLQILVVLSVVFVGVLFFGVISCHSKLIWCLERVVSRECGLCCVSYHNVSVLLITKTCLYNIDP